VGRLQPSQPLAWDAWKITSKHLLLKSFDLFGTAGRLKTPSSGGRNLRASRRESYSRFPGFGSLLLPVEESTASARNRRIVTADTGVSRPAKLRKPQQIRICHGVTAVTAQFPEPGGENNWAGSPVPSLLCDLRCLLLKNLGPARVIQSLARVKQTHPELTRLRGFWPWDRGLSALPTQLEWNRPNSTGLDQTRL